MDDGHLIAEHCGATSVGAENNRKATREGAVRWATTSCACVRQALRPQAAWSSRARAVLPLPPLELSCRRDVPCRPGWWPPLTTPRRAVVVARGRRKDAFEALKCFRHLFVDQEPCLLAARTAPMQKHCIRSRSVRTVLCPFVHRPSSLAPISNKSACIQDDDDDDGTKPNGLIPLGSRRSFRHT